MTSTIRLELEIDLLEKKKTAIDSDLHDKQEQYNSNMPCEEGVGDNPVAGLLFCELNRGRDRIDVEIAEKRVQVYDLQALQPA